MKRWLKSALLGLSLIAATLAWGQGIIREAPKDVKPAVIAVSATPPEISLDGAPDRLSPGVRIRDTNNMLVMSASLAGKTLYTVYRRDGAGLVHEVWLLTEQEWEKLGGTSLGDGQGHKRFAELLDIIFSSRILGLWK